MASTIAEIANNGIGVPGIAYGATIMPVRVLNRFGEGDAAAIADGIRYAADHGAQVINLSLRVLAASSAAAQIPEVIDALRYADSKGVVVVGAAGNEAGTAVAYPARARSVISVGATTEHLCLADYSNDGRGPRPRGAGRRRRRRRARTTRTASPDDRAAATSTR